MFRKMYKPGCLRVESCNFKLLNLIRDVSAKITIEFMWTEMNLCQIGSVIFNRNGNYMSHCFNIYLFVFFSRYGVNV